MPRVAVVEVVELKADEGGWVVFANLVLGPGVEPTKFVPKTSRWCIWMPLAYPRGKIRVFPAKGGGVEATFPHQDRNDPGDAELPWRTGKLCLDRASAQLGSLLVGGVPESAEDKLAWHVQRALAWLDAAAQDRLLGPEEPFELPQVKAPSVLRVVHDESAASFDAWRTRLGRWGALDFQFLPGASETLLARVFYDHGGAVIRRASRIQPSESIDRKGFWWLWPAPIVQAPWRAPSTWGDLRAIGGWQGVDVDGTLRRLVARGSTIQA